MVKLHMDGKKPKNSGDDIAIAIDYSPEESSAPKVVAKGQGWLAEQIIAIAEANGIEVKEDPDLAQLLSNVDVDSEIPLEAFTAVAEILSYVYRMNNQWPEGISPAPSEANNPDNKKA
ncbi:MAG: EscU/YscU/HrcU family type III secretion system export apparatus switch protein [Rhodospirillaceae bacterium]|nr:EscU/YscU/HrcU family type III secretion system export apparatus switch protein [Rhodospirillaceae bacterium]